MNNFVLFLSRQSGLPFFGYIALFLVTVGVGGWCVGYTIGWVLGRLKL